MDKNSMGCECKESATTSSVGIHLNVPVGELDSESIQSLRSSHRAAVKQIVKQTLASASPEEHSSYERHHSHEKHINIA